jgi:transketolase
MKITANDIRRVALELVYKSGSGHLGGSFSIAEIVACLHNNFSLKSGQEDKLILSKGHAAPAIYAALHLQGVLDTNELDSFRQIDSRLQGHPDKVRLPNVVATTGSLGQGLSIAIGHALAHKILKNDKKVFCIVGDGEMQEGQVWESIMLAPKFKLDNLYFIIDLNGAQNDGNVSDILPLDLGMPIQNKISSFGWDTHIINGHDNSMIQKLVTTHISNMPRCIVAKTQKGKGVSFMESFEWHAKAPNKEQYDQAIEELNQWS